MTRDEFFGELIPNYVNDDEVYSPTGKDGRKIYKNKEKDIKFIKKITREKIMLDGAPILYFPIDVNDYNMTSMRDDNILKDQTDLKLGKPINMMATWTPQEYQLDLSKWGIMMPSGSDQQLYIHVDELEERLGRKPLIGDIIETEIDRQRYKVSDVFFGHNNLWENIFCMLTLSKVTYDNYTSQLDEYDPTYNTTYTSLEKVLDISDGREKIKDNKEILDEKKKTDVKDKRKPRKKSIDTELDIMTMKL